MKKYNITDKQIKKLRDSLILKLKNYDGDKPVLLSYDSELLDIILFDRLPSGGKKFSTYLKEVLRKIDFSNVSFNNFIADYFDFTHFNGVIINPCRLYNKSLYYTKCSGVTFIGSFNECNIEGTNFKKSIGARINPQTIRNKSLSETNCTDVEFIGPFYNVNINNSILNLMLTGKPIDLSVPKQKSLSLKNNRSK